MSLGDELIAFMPRLKRFALRLCENPTYADDLVQETLLLAWEHRDRFAEGTNLKAWLFTILVNRFRSRAKFLSTRNEVYCSGAAIFDTYLHPGNQESHIELFEVLALIEELSADQRQALMLNAVNGYSTKEIAEMLECPESTIKVRVHRARKWLLKKLRVTSD